MGRLIEVLRTPDLQRAKLAVAALENLGLHPSLIAESLAEMLGAGSMLAPRRVMVPAAEEAEARAALAVLEGMVSPEGPRADDPERCPACGESWEPGFDACWSCGHESP